jgi:hypothetical protein
MWFPTMPMHLSVLLPDQNDMPVPAVDGANGSSGADVWREADLRYAKWLP